MRIIQVLTDEKAEKFFKELWMARYDLLRLLVCGLAVAWYGYTLRIIAKADIGIFPTILLYIGGFVFGIFTIISLYNAFSEDDE